MNAWVKTIAMTSLVALGVSFSARADDERWRQDRDDDRYERGARNGYSNGQQPDRAYQDGIRQGEYDRAHNLRYNDRNGAWRNADSSWRDAYRRGYERGYNNAYGNNYPYPDTRNNYPYSNNYPYARGPYGYGNNAYNIGLSDGRADGRNDRMTGHSYRPTHDDNYKHADRGYNSGYGSKDAYKQEYRSGYVSGYEQGYRYNR